jgi:26S proteasome regulatory subunit T5
VLLYGPPGTGKTLMARACAARTDSCFLKLAGPQLVQMFIGDGAKLVRDAFALAKEKAPAIIFIDELDAIGTKRFDSDKSGAWRPDRVGRACAWRCWRSRVAMRSPTS